MPEPIPYPPLLRPVPSLAEDPSDEPDDLDDVHDRSRTGPQGRRPGAPPDPWDEPPADPWPEDRWSRSWRLTRAGLADRVPVAVRTRWRVPPAAATAALAVACALLLGATARWLTAPGPAAVPLAPPASGAPTPAGAGPASAAGSTAAVPTPAAPGAVVGAGAGPVATLVVDVVGRVRRPGIVRLPAGSRVVDAVTAAGGAAPDAALELLNLARPVVDGEQILVPAPGQVPPAGAGGPAGAGTGPGTAGGGAGPVDLNRATEADLDGLPGIGPVLAGRIVAWRTGHGRFSSVDELGEVDGIGDRLLEQLRPLVTAG